MIFLTVVSYFYASAENEAYESLHVQTKQIKDDMQLQLLSDRENLATMANFAAKLYSDGESYNLMFESFKPIGLIENIGILTPDNTFVTKVGSVNLDGRISFEEEKARGEYISARVKDITRDNYEIIRSAVPIKIGNDVVGILYGVIKLDVIGQRYNKMAKELDAQLFVYDKESGNLIIDTIHDKLGNISFLKAREYNKGYSYEKMMSSDKGYTSFVSAYTGEDLYVHYSTLEELGWMITLARYESQVFAKTHTISRILFAAFFAMISIMILYTLILMANEKRQSHAMVCASNTRRLLLEINQQHNNISKALKRVCLFANSRSAVFFDTDGEDYNYSMPHFEDIILCGDERKYFISEILHYAAELHKVNRATVGVMCIRPNEHLIKTNHKFYDFLKEHNIKEISFAAVTKNDNRITVLGCINPQKSKSARMLLEDIAVCFSIAIYNKKHLSKTEIAATTDSLTGVANRVTYKKDLLIFDEMKPEKFSCIYIDVNELHLRNNKYGHAAGDEMLIYIANTLKEVFFSHHIYRMGGDEFLVFVENTDQEVVKKNIEALISQLNPKDYHVAIGMSYRTQNSNTEEMVKEAEIRMYEAKAQYYQNKEQQSISKTEDKGYVQVKTGIREIDAMISILKDHYNGIYRVSIETDKAHRILMPAYLGYNEDEEHFSELFKKYIEETVDPNFHRAIMSFLNYDALRRQLLEGNLPKITYKKVNGETVILSIYKLNDREDSVGETLWVFAKD
ncbi:MAG: GGDEF domain-containing protein [Clostridia bacterium]|nr:GGDEF domain-containing protein [Clostridia bacterium]